MAWGSAVSRLEAKLFGMGFRAVRVWAFGVRGYDKACGSAFTSHSRLQPELAISKTHPNTETPARTITLNYYIKSGSRHN